MAVDAADKIRTCIIPEFQSGAFPIGYGCLQWEQYMSLLLLRRTLPIT